MNTALLIYLVIQLDSIRILFGVILLVSVVALTLTSFFKLVFVLDGKTDNEAYKSVSRWSKKIAQIGVVAAIMFTLIPKTETATYMVGGAGVVELLQSEQAQEVGGKAYQLLMKKLDEELRE